MPNQEEIEYLRPPTPDVDPAVASLASRLSEPDIRDDGATDASDSDILAELEDDFDMGALREQRMEELKQEMERLKSLREQDHGKVGEITEEKEVIKTSAQEKRCVIHFYHRDFRRCMIMDKHLAIIAPKYFSTRFLRVFVENVPWLVEKLEIKVLPCVLCFVGGVSKDRITGFEDLGNNDAFETAELELRLQLSGVIVKPSTVTSAPLKTMYSSSHTRPRGIRGRNDLDDDEDSDD